MKNNYSLFRSYLERGKYKYKYDGLKGILSWVYYKIQKLLGIASDQTAYRRWIQINSDSPISLQTKTVGLSREILFSIVIPVFKPSRPVLEATLKSVFDQCYSNWEMCLSVSNASFEVRTWLESLQSQKVKISFHEAPLGISENTNAAISLANGEYVGFLDHDDLLASSALLEMALAIQACNPDVLYSDEDHITKDGKQRYSPHFKPDFSPELLLSMNYICHFVVVRKEFGDQVGWLDPKMNGSQDHDFLLRCLANNARFHHLPKILYHWRAVDTSSLKRSGYKSRANDAGVSAVSDYLKRAGLEGLKVIKGKEDLRFRIISERHVELVSIIIPNKDQVSLLKKCIESILFRSSYKNIEILIVENNSTEEQTFAYYHELEKKFSDVIKVLHWNGKFNYSSINNFAATAAKGEIILLLNNDIEPISSDWVERMLDFMKISEVGIVGAKLYYPDNSIQHAGVIVGLGGVAGHSHKHYPRSSRGYFDRLVVDQNLSAVTGACLMIRKSLFDLVGGLDEELEIAFNDVDLCLKVRSLGYRIVWTPFAELYHHESVSRGYEDSPSKVARFNAEVKRIKEKWEHILKAGDPFYSPHLTTDKEDFSIKI